jgi:hypothetical protein
MKRALIIAVALAAIGIAILIATQKEGRRASSKPNTVPLDEVRNEVKGKTANDVAKVVLQVPPVGVITVTNKADVAALLDGLREAVEPMGDRIGLAGPVITIYWTDGNKSYDYMFISSKGPDYAFGKKFAKAFNRLVPPESRVDMMHR